MRTIARTQLIDLVSSVRVRHPGVALQILDAPSSVLQERLLAGDLEVAISASSEGPPSERLRYIPLFREQFVVVVQPQHRLAKLPEVRVTDLAGERYLSRLNSEYGRPADRLFERQQIDCSTVYESERDDWILAMAAAGFGFGFMPEQCVDHPGVTSRRVVAPEFWREVALVTVRGRPHSPAVAALVARAMRHQRVNRLEVQAECAGRPCELPAVQASFRPMLGHDP